MATVESPTGKPVPVRIARLSDADGISRLTVQLGYEVDAPAVAARLSRILARQDQCFMVAELDDRLVGWVHAVVWEFVETGPFLLRDAIGGQSIGKLLLGLVVIDLETGRVSSFTGSMKRNLLLLLPGANVVAIFLETRTIISDPQGQRLGDKLAQTHVVEGAGARELVKSLQQWLMSLGSGLGHAAGGRRRLPGRIDRAA